MSLLLLVLVMLLLFGGGLGWHSGYYRGAPYPFYGGVGFIVLLIIVLLLFYRPAAWGLW